MTDWVRGDQLDQFPDQVGVPAEAQLQLDAPSAVSRQAQVVCAGVRPTQRRR